MIKIKQGNILDCSEDMIVHQVNIQGIMSGGLARQLADKYQDLEKDYYELCKENKFDYEELKGLAYIKQYNGKYIANIFSQKPSFETDYDAMKKALNYIKKWAENSNLSIAIPRNIGNGIANGINGMAEKIIREVFKDNTINVSMYELKE